MGVDVSLKGIKLSGGMIAIELDFSVIRAGMLLERGDNIK